MYVFRRKRFALTDCTPNMVPTLSLEGHQDAAYWGLDPPDSVNVWIALTDCTPKHGPMLHLKGSHRKPVTSDDATASVFGQLEGTDVVHRPP